MFRLTATLTATSADDGCSGWVVGVVVLAVEGVAQGVDGVTPGLGGSKRVTEGFDGLALEAESAVPDPSPPTKPATSSAPHKVTGFTER